MSQKTKIWIWSLSLACLCSCATARPPAARIPGGQHLTPAKTVTRPSGAAGRTTSPPRQTEAANGKTASGAAEPERPTTAASTPSAHAPAPPPVKAGGGDTQNLRTIALRQTAAAARHPEDDLYPGGMYEPPFPEELEKAPHGGNGGPGEGETRPEEAEEITGLVVEHTMSRIGSYFYQVFFLLWEAPEGTGGANIVITERLSPGWGSWIVIEIESLPVWGRILKPRNEEIEDAAAEAVQAVKEALINMQVTQQDLEGGDLEGDGI